MNEIVSLDQVVSEIKFFENQAVVSYWEIGKRLKKAKEQVGHGNWESWLKDNLNYSQNMAGKLIRICQTIPKSDLNQNLNFTQVYALTTVDNETRNEILEKENLKDKTVKETQEIIKKYKEEKAELEEENQGLKKANEELSRIAEREPEVIEKEVIKEIVPSDYEELKRQLKELQVTNSDLKNKLVIESNKKKLAIGELEEEQQKEKLMKEINSFAWTINGFIKEVGGLIYLTDYVNEVPKSSKDLFASSAKTLLDWSNQLNYNLENKEDIY